MAAMLQATALKRHSASETSASALGKNPASAKPKAQPASKSAAKAVAKGKSKAKAKK